MNIPVSVLKKFKHISAHVESNGILPIHKYLRFGDGFIVKNVSHAFVIFESEDCKSDKDEVILVPELDLYSLLSVTTSSFISISRKKDKVELNDGRDKIIVQTPPTREFNIPAVESKEVILSEEFMTAVAQAALFANPVKDGPEYYGFVHIGENAVCSGEGFTVYHHPIKEDVKIVLKNKIAQTLSKLNINSFSESTSHYYFRNPEAVFGFSKPDTGWFDITRLFKQKREYSFTLSASDISSFNNLALQLSKTASVTISDGKFEMNDMLLDKHHEREAHGIKLPAPFTYKPEGMNTVIKGLDVEELDFSDSVPAYYISSKDTKATAIIAKIQKPQ